MNVKERAEDFVFPTDLEIPQEFAETLQTYITTIEESKGKATKK